MSDLNALLLYARIVDAGSFSQAARNMVMPVSTLSRKIAELEDQLGVRLLERSTRQMRVTEIGQDILDQARRTAEIKENVSNLVASHQSEIQGILRITATAGVVEGLVSQLITGFQLSYPQIRIHVKTANHFIDLIADGVDLAFRHGPMGDSALIAKMVLRYRHQLYASPQYILENGLPACPADLNKHRYVAFSLGSSQLSRSFISDDSEKTISFMPHLAFNDYSSVARALVSGAGIGDLTPVVARKYVHSGELEEVLPDWHLNPLELFLVHLGSRHLPRQVRLFMDYTIDLAPKIFSDLPQ